RPRGPDGCAHHAADDVRIDEHCVSHRVCGRRAMTTGLLAAPECTLDRSIKTVPHAAARQRMLKSERGGVFRSDWLDAVFIHMKVDRNALAQCTPYELDLFEGEAYVSLVAFHMRRFRVRG